MAGSEKACSLDTPDVELMQSLAEFAAGAGHEINNPLASIVGRAQQLLRDETDPQKRHALSVIAGQAFRIRDMISDLMAFARPPAPNYEQVWLGTGIVAPLLETLAPTLAASGCTVQFDLQRDSFIHADISQISCVISELLRNAATALEPEGGIIHLVVTTTAPPCHPGLEGGITVTVIDHGRGLTDQEQQFAFSPFYSGRPAGRGLGFGLPKAWQIARQHGGELSLSSAPEGPTQAILRLPIRQNVKL